jgi:SAM-dependent methyltransferase
VRGGHDVRRISEVTPLEEALLMTPDRALSSLLALHRGRVGVDLGCGDARATARWAATEPEALIIGIDANLDTAGRAARRAGRAREKGGLPNLVLLRASADALPEELAATVDELRIELPWGSLLESLLPAPGSDATEAGEFAPRLAHLLASRGVIRITLNARALPEGVSREEAEARLRAAFESAGLSDVQAGSTAIRPGTGWGKRLAGGRPLEVVVAEAHQPDRS